MANPRLKILYSYLKPYSKMMYLGMFALFAVNVVGVSIPWLIHNIFDDLQESFTFNQLITYVIILVILALACVMWGMRM